MPHWVRLPMVLVFFEIRLSRNGGVYVDVFAAKFNGVTGDPRGLVGGHLAGGHVEAPSMPGTGNHVSLQRALTQRSAPVKAGIANSVKLAPYIGQGNRHCFQTYFADLTRGDVGGLRYAHKCHGYSCETVSSYMVSVRTCRC